MYYTVFQLGKLRAVPAACSPDKVTGDSLELVYIVTVAFRTLVHVGISTLVSAVHASVAVVVYRAVSDVVFVHQVHD